MDRERRNRYYKHIVKRHLNDIRTQLEQSKNEMERNYYSDRYAVQLDIYAKALGIQKRFLERYVNNKTEQL